MTTRLPLPAGVQRQEKERKKKKEPEQDLESESDLNEFQPKNIDEKLMAITAMLHTIIETQAWHTSFLQMIEAEILAEAGKVPDSHEDRMKQADERHNTCQTGADLCALLYQSRFQQKYLELRVEQLTKYGR
jgi:hypothetical protein